MSEIENKELEEKESGLNFVEQIIADIYEQLSEESEEELDFTTFFEDLYALSQSPINLNTATKSDLEKLHSGNKIVEIRIESVNDILQIAENGIIESNDHKSEYYNDFEKENLRSVSFYGFKKRDYTNSQISNKIEFKRYILHESGKIQFFPEVCDCKRLMKSKTSSLLEVCIHSADSFGLYKQIGYIGFQRFKIPNCILCRNYVDSYSGMGKICRLYKHLQIPRYEDFDTARAKTCQYFAIDWKEMQSALKNRLKGNYTIFCERQNTDNVFTMQNTPHSHKD